MTTPYEEGNPEARLLILGQAPAKEEVRLGRPLVGPAGQILKDCMAKAGVTRKDCYILNVWEDEVYKVKMQADRLAVKGGFQVCTPSGGLTQLGWEMAAPTIARINAASPNCILPLGNQALEVVMGRKGVTKWRGSILWSEIFQRKVVPTIHPAGSIHGVYVWRFFIEHDLRRAWEEARSPEMDLPRRDILIARDIECVHEAFAECYKAGRIATDLEVIGGQVACFSIAPTPWRCVVVPLRGPKGHCWSEDDELAIWLAYARIMADQTIEKVNQNLVGFDAPFLFQQNRIRTRGRIGDPMIAYNILYPGDGFPKNLGHIASIYTREPYYKDEGKMWRNPQDAGADDWPTFWRYNGKDACVALECWLELRRQLEAWEMTDTYNWTVDWLEPILGMTGNGLPVNQTAIKHLCQAVLKEIEIKEQELNELVGSPLDVFSPKQCAAYFYGQLGLTPYVSKANTATTDDTALARIYRKAGPGAKEAKLVQELRGLGKLVSTYLSVKLDQDGRLRCSWNPRGTWTGRLSSSQTVFGTGLNLQNLDPRMKPFITGE